MLNIENFTGGAFVPAQSGKTMPVYEPSKGKQYAEIPDSGIEDVEAAYASAQEAFPVWSAFSAEKRCEVLLRLADLIEARYEEFAVAEAKDTGKPLWLTRKVDIYRAAANFRFFATAAVQFASESHSMPGEAINYTLRSPIGVVGCISPWNLPLYLFTWKIAPALAAGNTVVAKPSEITPLTAWMLASLCNEAGLPPGTLNIIHGSGAACGNAIVSHPGIKAISFTGGTSTGAHIASVAAPMFKKLSLELGGKNPNLIFADCSVQDAVETSVRAAFTNQGQICLCGSRIFVERSIYEEFTAKFIQQTQRIKVGDNMHPESFMGALVSEQHLRKIESYVALALEEGGTILTGGHTIQPEGECSEGWFYAPTVIGGLKHTDRTCTEEIFGPVVVILPFDTEEQALEYANYGNYGLASMVWTSNLSRAHRVAEKIQAGIVWVNCWMLRDLRTPFGGVKQSGVGREGGWEAMRFFTEPKNVCIKY